MLGGMSLFLALALCTAAGLSAGLLADDLRGRTAPVAVAVVATLALAAVFCFSIA